MKNTFVDAQPPAVRPAEVVDFDEAPAPQRPDGCERAPMRRIQHRQRQPEGGALPARFARGNLTLRGELRIHLGPGAQQQYITLEALRPKAVREMIDRGRCRHCRAGSIPRLHSGLPRLLRRPGAA